MVQGTYDVADDRRHYHRAPNYRCLNRGKQKTGFSKVVVRDGDFPDDDYTSDHRPIFGLVSLSDTPSIEAFRVQTQS